MSQRGWARSSGIGVDNIRRGAWYEVLDESEDGKLVLSVHGHKIRIDGARVSRRLERPAEWSVVVRFGVMRPTWSNAWPKFRTTYAVCPSCTNRQDPRGRPETLTCEACGQTFPVDWSATC